MLEKKPLNHESKEFDDLNEAMPSGFPTEPMPSTQPLPVNLTQKRIEEHNASRLMILQNIVPVACNLLSPQIEAFYTRLFDMLSKVSKQNIRPDEARICQEALQILKRNNIAFYRIVAAKINAALTKEVSIFNTRRKARENGLEKNTPEVMPQTMQEMEERILVKNITKNLEVHSDEAIHMLNALIGRVLNRIPIDITQNPFRPEVFLQATYQAWKELCEEENKHLVVLRLLQTDVFFELRSIYEGINQELMNRGILLDVQAHEEKPSIYASLQLNKNFSQNSFLQEKLQNIFYGNIELKILDDDDEDFELQAASASLLSSEEDWDEWQSAQNAVHPRDSGLERLEKHSQIDDRFFSDLHLLQKSISDNLEHTNYFASNLRSLLHSPIAHKMTVVDRNTVEFLARMFDYIFAEKTLRAEIKRMIYGLQIPILRVALHDKDFFFKERHPARTLLDMLGSSGLVIADEGHADPLVDVLHDVVDKVQHEYDEQIDLFSNVVVDLEAYLQDEAQKAEQAIIQPVQAALSEEKMRIAREMAEHDVAIRVETGEVSSFLESFLTEQWSRILTIAHSVKNEKPQALENALKTMDDLIWSLKPKNTAEECRELTAKIPSMLTLLNAWLNAIRWDEPERVIFFSKLAERHAALARAPLELSPRRQLEIAVNIAQRASNRRLDKMVNEKRSQEEEDAIKQVEALECGMWLDFIDEKHHTNRYKLAWISPKRTGFIFTNRQGTESFSLSDLELMRKYQSGLVNMILENSLVDRAMTYAMNLK